jgi:hypothetical protein
MKIFLEKLNHEKTFKNLGSYEVFMLGSRVKKELKIL